MSLYTNNTPQDTVRNAFYQLAENVSDIFIASPFFSYDALITELLDDSRQIKLIVRLGPATSPTSLKKIIVRDEVQIRFFTSPLFHSKLYIFGEKAALVGSANLTDSGFQRNRELSVVIHSDDVRFSSLQDIYQSYWNQADVLTNERLEKYAKIYSNSNDSSKENTLESKVMDAFGDLVPRDGIGTSSKEQSRKKLEFESYRRTYQEFLAAFREIEDLYLRTDKRKLSEDVIPLRIEIDQFFNFIFESFAKGERYKDAKLLQKADRAQLVNSKLNEWFDTSWPYLENDIPSKYDLIAKTLSTTELIHTASMDELLRALFCCHSVHDRPRFAKGGLSKLKEMIRNENSKEQFRKVLTYLLHGKDDFITRMGNCIHDEEWSLNMVGRSGFQELLGWVNKDNVPICNGRTVKSLRYLGYDVVVFVN